MINIELKTVYFKQHQIVGLPNFSQTIWIQNEPQPTPFELKVGDIITSNDIDNIYDCSIEDLNVIWT